jgi:hypothetical protein
MWLIQMKTFESVGGEKKLRSYCMQLQARQQVFSMVFLALLKNETAVPNIFALS